MTFVHVDRRKIVLLMASICRIATQPLRRYYLRRKQRRPHPPWLDPESDAFRRAIGVSLAEQTLDDSPNLEQALLSLPKVQAAVLLLHIRDKQSWEEIARRLDMSIEEVQHHLAQGLARLRLSCWEL